MNTESAIASVKHTTSQALWAIGGLTLLAAALFQAPGLAIQTGTLGSLGVGAMRWAIIKDLENLDGIEEVEKVEA